jgi:CheY-like chemotaxis protein
MKKLITIIIGLVFTSQSIGTDYTLYAKGYTLSEALRPVAAVLSDTDKIKQADRPADSTISGIPDRRLFILDDKRESIESIKSAFSRSYNYIRHAQSLEEAMRAIDENPTFDLVISDLDLSPTIWTKFGHIHFDGQPIPTRIAGMSFVLWLRNHPKRPKRIILNSTVFNSKGLDYILAALTGSHPAVIRNQLEQEGIIVQGKEHTYKGVINNVRRSSLFAVEYGALQLDTTSQETQPGLKGSRLVEGIAEEISKAGIKQPGIFDNMPEDLRSLATQEFSNETVAKSSSAGKIDKPASVKKVTELIWQWNFRIYELSYKRAVFLENGQTTGNIGKSLSAIVNQIQRNMPGLEQVLSDRSIEKIKTSMPLLLRRKKADEKIPAPNEPAANMLLASIITTDLKELKDEIIANRVSFESDRPRVYYRNNRWYVRERRSVSSAKWNTSVFEYRDIPYYTLWEAFRSVDHQIDTEIKERNWLTRCISLLGEIADNPNPDIDRLKLDVDSMLSKLKHIRVEDKRLARIILETARILLDLEKIEQSKGLFHIAKILLAKRAEEIELIIAGLTKNRTQELRQHLDSKTRYLRDKVAKILHNLNSGHYGLTRKIIDEDLLSGYGARYFNEPNFEMFQNPLGMISDKMKRGNLKAEDIDSLKRFFTLFKDWFIDSIRTDNFMRDFRDNFAERSHKESLDIVVKEDIFDETFEDHKKASRQIQADPIYYRNMFYQAAFISPKIGRPQDRQANPSFIETSNELVRFAAQRAGINPQGIELLITEPAVKSRYSAGSHLTNILLVHKSIASAA